MKHLYQVNGMSFEGIMSATGVRNVMKAVSPVKSVYHRAISCVLTLEQSTCVTAAPNNCSPQQLNMTQLLVIVSLLSLRYGFKIFHHFSTKHGLKYEAGN